MRAHFYAAYYNYDYAAYEWQLHDKNVFIIPYLPFPPQIALRTASAFRPICVIVATSKLAPCFKIESEFIFS